MRTVYVIGAGASSEAKLPLGLELKDKIAKLLNIEFDLHKQISGDPDIFNAIKNENGTTPSNERIGELIKKCTHISSNMPLAISIDNFIDSERNDKDIAFCGKVAIVKSILTAERSSEMHQIINSNKSINFSRLENTWYLRFFRAITENCAVDDLANRFKLITLIVYNYDRCIEHFLCLSLTSYYKFNERTAADIISNLTIIHPYGTVGDLGWQSQNNSSIVEFGGNLHWTQLAQYANRIKTFTEGSHDETVKKIRSSMTNTERLVFLGFAFHRLNMNLLGSENKIGRLNNEVKIDCYATTKGSSKSDQEKISNDINYLYKGKININVSDVSCAQLFSEYSRSLGYQ